MKKATERDAVLAEKIQKLRGQLNQRDFAAKLGVAQPRIGDWERGIRPTNEALSKLAKYAPDFETKKYFWQKAGLDLDAVYGLVQADFLQKRQRTNPEEFIKADVFPAPVYDEKTVISRQKAHRVVLIPSAYFPESSNTFCLEVGKTSKLLPGLLDAGDLAIIDGSRTGLLDEHIFNGPCVHAVYFEQTPNLRASRFYTVGSISGLGDIERRNREEHLGPSVAIGWVRLARSGEDVEVFDPATSDRPWCFVLQTAWVREVKESGNYFEMMHWRQGILPRSESELQGYLHEKRVRVLGTVIGWISGQRKLSSSVRSSAAKGRPKFVPSKG